MRDLFAPLALIRPDHIIEKYQDWIYFLIFLVFYIALAGIALRRHFQKAYVKPLIIALGLFLTIGTFKQRHFLMSAIEGWGSLGYVAMLLMAGIFPYGLMRSLGASQARAIHLSYVLIYVVAWSVAPQLFELLNNSGLGIISLGLTIWFCVALWKLFRGKKGDRFQPEARQNGPSPDQTRTQEMVAAEEIETGLVLKEAKDFTGRQLENLEGMSRLLSDIRSYVKERGNQLSRQERGQAAGAVAMILKKEMLLKEASEKARSNLARMRRLDAKQVNELRQKMKSARRKEKPAIKSALHLEEQKRIIEESLLEMDKRLEVNIQQFTQLLNVASKAIQQAPYPLDALAPLVQAGRSLSQIRTIVQAIRDLDVKLCHIIKNEEKTIKHAA